MSKNMLSLEEIDGQTALELPERALLDGFDVSIGVAASASSGTNQSSASNASSNNNNPTIVVVEDDH
jgi:hypothetical protein